MSDEARGYLRHLPEIFGGRPPSGEEPFVGRYLKIFEALLSGRDDAKLGEERVAGLEERITGFADYLDPLLTPVDDPDEQPVLKSEFLDYLASWIALTFDQNWDLGRKREWLRRIVPLYKRRGTFSGLTAYLQMFVGTQVTLEEPPGGFILGEKEKSTVGVNIYLGGAPPYFFKVNLNYGFPPEPFKISVWRNLIEGTRAIVDLEKPAHTYYRLDARTLGFKLAERSTIAEDTLIWGQSTPV